MAIELQTASSVRVKLDARVDDFEILAWQTKGREPVALEVLIYPDWDDPEIPELVTLSTYLQVLLQVDFSWTHGTPDTKRSGTRAHRTKVIMGGGAGNPFRFSASMPANGMLQKLMARELWIRVSASSSLFSSSTPNPYFFHLIATVSPMLGTPGSGVLWPIQGSGNSLGGNSVGNRMIPKGAREVRFTYTNPAARIEWLSPGGHNTFILMNDVPAAAYQDWQMIDPEAAYWDLQGNDKQNGMKVAAFFR